MPALVLGHGVVLRVEEGPGPWILPVLARALRGIGILLSWLELNSPPAGGPDRWKVAFARG
jgi:hypothetical protein